MSVTEFANSLIVIFPLILWHVLLARGCRTRIGGRACLAVYSLVTAVLIAALFSLSCIVVACRRSGTLAISYKPMTLTDYFFVLVSLLLIAGSVAAVRDLHRPASPPRRHFFFFAVCCGLWPLLLVLTGTFSSHRPIYDQLFIPFAPLAAYASLWWQVLRLNEHNECV